MTTTPAVYAQFGQTLAFAERTLTTVLRDHLAQRDTSPETWYALRLLADRGPGLPDDALVDVLAGSRALNPALARDLIDRLKADGLVRGDATLDLTSEGETLYRSLRDHVLGATAQLLSQFDISDIETTVRTLQGITSRASEDYTTA